MKIDITKKYRTRDGRDVIIHAINGPDGAFPVVASVQNASAWMAGKWRITGTGASEASDLIEIREPREWKATVIRETDVLAGYDNGDEHDEDYEVVRVREIL